MNDYEERIKAVLKPERYIHSMGVAETAAKLAGINGADIEKAYTAGILHDIAKQYSYEQMMEKCREYGFEPDEISKTSGALLHAPLGAIIAEREFNIKDKDIISAIECHTVAKMGMSVLDKIIYIADMTEPGRCFDGVDDIRKAVFENLDRGVVMGLEATVRHTLNEGLLLHPGTVFARNEIITEIHKQEKM